MSMMQQAGMQQAGEALVPTQARERTQPKVSLRPEDFQSRPAPPPSAVPLPQGIFPLSTGPAPRRGFAPLPAELREASLPPAADPATLVRSVTGAVVAVSAAIRSLSAALAREEGNDADIARAMAALDAAVADQAITARAVLKRLSDGSHLLGR